MKTIYGLCAADGIVRYVGQTKLPLNQRLQRWRSNAKVLTRRAPVFQWVRETPDLRIVPLEVSDDPDACERKWIAELRSTGSLLNMADGGPGCPGAKQDAEAKAKKSAAIKRSWARETNRVRWSPTEEQLAKQRANVRRGDDHPRPFLGRKHTAETKAKMSASAKRWREERRNAS